jgi:hypothetical protein
MGKENVRPLLRIEKLAEGFASLAKSANRRWGPELAPPAPPPASPSLHSCSYSSRAAPRVSGSGCRRRGPAAGSWAPPPTGTWRGRSTGWAKPSTTSPPPLSTLSDSLSVSSGSCSVPLGIYVQRFFYEQIWHLYLFWGIYVLNSHPGVMGPWGTNKKSVHFIMPKNC